MSVLSTIGLQQSIRRGWPIAILAFIDHPDGAQRLWSGLGDLEWDGSIYQGVGRFGSVEGVGGTMQLGVRQVIFRLAGTPPEAAAQLDASIRNRPARAWLAGLDEDGRQVNGTAWQIVDGKADYQQVEIDDGGQAEIRLIVADPIFQLEEAKQLVWSAEQIKADFGPDISGLDLIHLMRDRALSWTKEPPQ